MTSLPTFDQVFKPPKTSLKRKNNQTENDMEPESRLETFLQKYRDHYRERYGEFEKKIAKWFAENEFERGKVYHLKIFDDGIDPLSLIALNDIVEEMRKNGHIVAKPQQESEFDSKGFPTFHGFILTFGAE